MKLLKIAEPDCPVGMRMPSPMETVVVSELSVYISDKCGNRAYRRKDLHSH
jgi:hypothetical protein